MNDQPTSSGSRWEPTDQTDQQTRTAASEPPVDPPAYDRAATGAVPRSRLAGRGRAIIAGAAVGLLGVGGLGGYAIGTTAAGGERGDDTDVVDVGGPFGGDEDPADPSRLVAVVPVRHGAVATSGAAHRGEHVVDARTGAPPRGVASVTVVGDDLTWADLDATAAFALGREALGWLTTRSGRAGVVVWEDGTAETFGRAPG